MLLIFVWLGFISSVQNLGEMALFFIFILSVAIGAPNKYVRHTKTNSWRLCVIFATANQPLSVLFEITH
jgi:uncharacterized membrane protein